MEQNKQKTGIDQLYQNSPDPREAYICTRIQGQIEYFNAQSKKNKKVYHTLSIVAIVANAVIPVCSVFLKTADGSNGIKVTIAALSSVALVITSLLTLFNAKELWSKYRRSASCLTSLLHQYYTRAGLFENRNEQDAFQLLAKMTEEYLDEENKTWSEMVAKQGTKSASDSVSAV